MGTKKQQDSFWTSYSDLMTSLFFVVLVLFIICIVRVGYEMSQVKETNDRLDSLLLQLKYEKALAEETNERMDSLLHEANADKEQLEQILLLDSLFSSLSRNTTLAYSEEKRMFYAKDFVGIEIFYPNQAQIKKEYVDKVNSVGQDILNILQSLNNNNDFHYQLVIEGNAAIKWDQLKRKLYDPDNQEMYMLSYRRALALYNRWKSLNFRQYNTEIIIAGSGFNGNNRDNITEENNKRFVIQIIPKINRPKTLNLIDKK